MYKSVDASKNLLRGPIGFVARRPPGHPRLSADMSAVLRAGLLALEPLTTVFRGVQVCFALLFIMFQGCAVFRQGAPPLPPVTYEEVIQLSRDKVPSDDIIRKIDDSNTVFRLNSDEVTELRQQGVDAKVVDFMMNTYVEKVRRDQEMRDWNRWCFYNGRYYWWPPWYYDYYYPFYRPYRGHRHK